MKNKKIKEDAKLYADNTVERLQLENRNKETLKEELYSAVLTGIYIFQTYEKAEKEIFLCEPYDQDEDDPIAFDTKEAAISFCTDPSNNYSWTQITLYQSQAKKFKK